jgi:hypothetical protein
MTLYIYGVRHHLRRSWKYFSLEWNSNGLNSSVGIISMHKWMLLCTQAFEMGIVIYLLTIVFFFLPWSQIVDLVKGFQPMSMAAPSKYSPLLGRHGLLHYCATILKNKALAYIVLSYAGYLHNTTPIFFPPSTFVRLWILVSGSGNLHMALVYMRRSGCQPGTYFYQAIVLCEPQSPEELYWYLCLIHEHARAHDVHLPRHVRLR